MEPKTMEPSEMERRASERRNFAQRAASVEPRAVEARAYAKNYFPWVSWGAIWAGFASGMGTYILLALLGLAGGLSAINPQSTQPVGNVPTITGIWTSISLVLSAFVGGYVAARMSGLSRVADGILHGLVAWGASTLVFAVLVTTSIGSAVGGAFSMVGRTAETAVTAGAASPTTQGRLEAMLRSPTGGTVNAQALSNLQDRLAAGDRSGAMSVMVNEMGFTQQRAAQDVDRAMALYRSAQQTATTAVSGMAKISWGIFLGVLVSLGLAIAGGVAGAKAVLKRRQPLAST